VDGAALRRNIAPERSQCLLQPAPAIDNQQFRLAQSPFDEIVENRTPSRVWFRRPWS
jgi:hypothetical protein